MKGGNQHSVNLMSPPNGTAAGSTNSKQSQKSQRQQQMLLIDTCFKEEVGFESETNSPQTKVKTQFSKFKANTAAAAVNTTTSSLPNLKQPTYDKNNTKTKDGSSLAPLKTSKLIL